MTKKRFLSYLIPAVAVYLALMTVFTFCDYEITDALFRPGTPFGKIPEVLGPLFMPFCMIYGCVGVGFSLKTRGAGRFFAFFGLALAFLYATFIGVTTFRHSFAPWLFIPSIVAYAAFTAFTLRLNLGICRRDEKFRLLHRSIVSVIFVTALVSLLGVDIVKSVFGRVRYLNLIDPAAYRPWYRLNRFDFNSSFPSGHASRAASSVCFALLPLYAGKKPSIPLELLSLSFTLTVSVSRLLEGMHYPSDVLTGAFLTFTAYFVCKRVFLGTAPDGTRGE